jgi:hypothetical protein
LSTRLDIAEVIGYMKLAFPNYAPDVTSPINTLDVLFDLLGDFPAETLRLAVRAACAEAGRAFAPAAGEIREMAIRLSISAPSIPTEFDAWAELCRMPKDMLRSHIEVDAEGKMITNETGAVIINVERLAWSHPLVEHTAMLMGWPDFPSEDESLDRAHFFQAYRAGMSRMMEEAGELPAVRQFIEGRRREAALLPPQPIVQVLKGSVAGGIPKSGLSATKSVVDSLPDQQAFR